MLIFPIFSLKNQYDSYLSNSYYSSNLNNAYLVLTKKAYHNLPYYIRRYCKAEKEGYVLSIKDWCLDELSVSCVPEYRIFKNVQHYIIQLTQTNSTEVSFVFIERKKILEF